MNDELKKIFTQDIKELKSLPPAIFENLKLAFEKIYNNNISVAESYRNIIFSSTEIDMNTKVKVEKPFYDIGFLISTPPRTGRTNMLDEAYQKDVPNGSVSFIQYQQQLMDEAYKLLVESLNSVSN
jgi:hypothetical protein